MVKELDKQFEKKGEIFTQIEKGDNYYIYYYIYVYILWIG